LEIDIDLDVDMEVDRAEIDGSVMDTDRVLELNDVEDACDGAMSEYAEGVDMTLPGCEAVRACACDDRENRLERARGTRCRSRSSR
jgi:hypothetical protein